MRYSNENVAHEMRTPLSSIILIIEMLLSLGCTHMKHKRRVLHYYRLVKF